jgi:hypothetical protein
VGEFMPIVIVGVVVLAIAGVIWGAIRAKKRREAMAAFAAQHNLRFTRAKDWAFDERFAEYDCLRRGDDRYAFNRMEGEWAGRTIWAFDYHYETHSTDSKGRRKTTHHYFSAVILRSRQTLKPLIIRSENLFDKLASVFGYDDIDFESAEFSKAFCVKSPDRKWAYDVLHPRTMEFLLTSPRFSIEFDPCHVIAWRSGRMSVEQFHDAVKVIEGILDRLPAYLADPR